MKTKRNAKIFRNTPRNLARLASALRRGELVAVPTETVYGLAANALDARACREIFRAKGRPATDPLIVHLASVRDLDSIAEPNAAALKLAQHFWPGPLTLILPKRSVIPDTVTSGRSTVAVRVPAHPVFRRLLDLTGLPLAAPSANRFGYVSPTTAAHVKSGLQHRISYILDGGAAHVGIESTIVDARKPHAPRILRPGFISAEQIGAVLGRRPTVISPRPRGTNGAQLAPGLLKRHYSPLTPVVLHEKMALSSASKAPNEAWVFLRAPAKKTTAPNVFWLSRDGSLEEVARRLFALLRDLDDRQFARINVQVPKKGSLAPAINDRLRRAAAR